MNIEPCPWSALLPGPHNLESNAGGGKDGVSWVGCSCGATGPTRDTLYEAREVWNQLSRAARSALRLNDQPSRR